jgi:leader peptidase (prepilin peptidase)/N-methyltransferase
VPALVLTWFLIALTFIDVDTQLLPDSMTLPLVWLGVATSALLPTDYRASLPVSLHDSVIGAMAGYLSLWGIYHLFKLLTGKEGMGYGDFKLLAAIGAFLGWRMLLPTALCAAAVGAVVGIVILTLQRKGRGVPIAFGPFLSAAGWIMMMWGRELLDGYLGLFGLHA